MVSIRPPGSPSTPKAFSPTAPQVVPTAGLPQNTFPGQLPFAKASPNMVGIGVGSVNTPEMLYPPVPPELLPITIGDSGTMRYGGFFNEEYESLWANNTDRSELVEQMRRGDARVAQLLKAVKAPMLACEFDVECASDKPADQEMVEFIKQNLFEMKGRTWENFFREALTSLEFGFSIFEQCYEMVDGKIVLKDLAPRIQHSILRWKLSNGARGVVQILRTDEAANYYVEIPIKKCVVFTNDMEGDDITGIPLLRYCYKHWYMKNNLYQIAAISAERFGVGVPVITLPAGSGQPDFDAATSLVQNLRTNESSGIVLPNKDWTLTILTPAGRSSAGEDIKDQIEHHDLMILHAGLCAFLNLGTTDTGSFALSTSAKGFFLTYIQDRMKYYVSEINRQVIAPLLELNNMKPSKPIQLTFTKLGDKDLAALATTLKTLSDAGLLKNDSKLMQWVANNMGLPELTEDDLAMIDIKEVESQLPNENPTDQKTVTPKVESSKVAA